VRPQRVRGVLVLLALACTPRAAHAASSDRVEDPAQQEEVEAFRAAQKRFEERMLELEEDTKSFVDFREQEELANVKAQYEETIASLLESKSQQREQAIARFETFLVR
jgi:predicted lipoprotein